MKERKPKVVEPLSQERLREEVTFLLGLIIKNYELAAILEEREQVPDFTAQEGMMICVAGMATEQAIQDQINYIRSCGTKLDEFKAMFESVQLEAALDAATPTKLAN